MLDTAMRDTTLFVVDSSGVVVAHYVDGGACAYSKLSFDSQTGETYSVRVVAFNNDEFVEGNHDFGKLDFGLVLERPGQSDYDVQTGTYLADGWTASDLATDTQVQVAIRF